MPSSGLDHITVSGFKSIAAIEKLTLRPINLVIGANGSGKSNFLGVFDLLHAIAEERLMEYVIAAGGADKILHFGSKTTKLIHLGLAFSNEGQSVLVLYPTAGDSLYPQELAGREVNRRTKTWRIYHLNDTSESSPLRKTPKVDDNRFLRHDGSNLPAFLYYLRHKHEASYSLIVRTMQRMAPFFDDFRLDPLQFKPDDIKLEWRHKSSDQYFDASSLSDGTLRFITLATLFLQPEELRPSLILVDEPELGLHPYAIELLAALVRQASVNTQVILSTLHHCCSTILNRRTS